MVYLLHKIILGVPYCLFLLYTPVCYERSGIFCYVYTYTEVEDSYSGPKLDDDISADFMKICYTGLRIRRNYKKVLLQGEITL